MDNVPNGGKKKSAFESQEIVNTVMIADSDTVTVAASETVITHNLNEQQLAGVESTVLIKSGDQLSLDTIGPSLECTKPSPASPAHDATVKPKPIVKLKFMDRLKKSLSGTSVVRPAKRLHSEIASSGDLQEKTAEESESAPHKKASQPLFAGGSPTKKSYTVSIKSVRDFLNQHSQQSYAM
jgi:hypothetical protein